MAIALAQTPKLADTGFVSALTLPAPALGSPVTPGSKLLAFGGCTGNTSVTFSDSAGNAWNTLTGLFWSNTGYFICIGWADNVSGASSVVVTATYGVSSQLRMIGVAEFTGLATGGPDAVATGRQAPAADPISGNAFSPSTSGDLILSVAAGDSAVNAAGVGYTLLGINTPSNTGSAFEYLIQAVAGSITPTFDLVAAQQMNVISAAFKAAAPKARPIIRRPLNGLIAR